MSKLYNEEIKEKFLDTYDNEQTQKTIRNVFQHSYIVESVLEKDLFSFSQDEIGKTIENSNPYSLTVAKSYGRFIAQYISWAMPYRNSNLNPMQGVTDEWYEKWVGKKKIHYSYDEFIDLLKNPHMVNYQDKALLFLMFEGIIGQEMIEIRELTCDDIDWDNCEIYIKSRDKKIKVHQDCINYLQKACVEDIYYNYSTKKEENKEKDLLPSPYVFKNIKSARGIEGEQISAAVLYGRINTLKDEFNLEYLTPNALKMSGEIAMMVDIWNKKIKNDPDAKIEYEDFEKIGEKYNTSMVHNNGYDYYNTSIMKQWINESKIKELYGIDVKF